MHPLAHSHKKNIRQCFNRSAHTYDDRSATQQHAGNQLIQLLLNYCNRADALIDLGCGTGITTELLAKQMRYQRFQAIDIADQLLAKAEHRLSHYEIDTTVADFDTFYSNTTFDMIFSNMALHWSLDLEFTLDFITNKLAKNGLIAFTIPLLNTFRELPASRRNNFYSAETIIALIKKFKCQFLHHHAEYIPIHFESPLAAMKSIKATGANYVVSIPSPPSLRGRFSGLSNPENIMQARQSTKNLATNHKKSRGNPFISKPTTLTYHIGYFIARKSSGEY